MKWRERMAEQKKYFHECSLQVILSSSTNFLKIFSCLVLQFLYFHLEKYSTTISSSQRNKSISHWHLRFLPPPTDFHDLHTSTIRFHRNANCSILFPLCDIRCPAQDKQRNQSVRAAPDIPIPENVDS